jgi:pyrroloquinoline quinone (PQQ) biosynthesis protein C
MPYFDDLLAQTREARDAFIATPIIQRTLRDGVDRDLYLDFLGQAYHHVRHTCRLLSCAVARCGDQDQRYVDALFEYIEEEKGHEEWILNDIRDLGGDAEAVRNGQGDLSCRLMVAYAYYAIEHISPYALLGMVHVLEGMSAALALAAASKLKEALGIEGDIGFSYLSSHGTLDQEHVAFFQNLVNGLDDPDAQHAIVDTAKVIYRLYGDIFTEIDNAHAGARDAA